MHESLAILREAKKANESGAVAPGKEAPKQEVDQRWHLKQARKIYLHRSLSTSLSTDDIFLAHLGTLETKPIRSIYL